MQDEPVLVDTSACLFTLRKDFLLEIKDRLDLLLNGGIIDDHCDFNSKGADCYTSSN